MYFFSYILIFCSFFCLINSYYVPNNRFKLSQKLYSKSNNKIDEFKKLIRINNFFPTLLLNVGSGYITSRSIQSLISNKPFITTCIVTQLITFSSMIINDLFDIKLDLINNPSRPLVTQTIKTYEAIIITILFYSISIILNNTQVYGISRNIGNISIILSILYTPIFKKITFVKNLICSFVVSNTVLYSGLYSDLYSGLVLNNHYNYNLLYTFAKIIFASSLYIEILQDVQDVYGDKQNNINTLPVVFGNDKSIKIIFSIYFIIILDILKSYSIINRYNNWLLIPLIPSIINLLNIKKENYSSYSINKAIKNTSYMLILLLSIIFIIK